MLVIDDNASKRAVIRAVEINGGADPADTRWSRVSVTDVGRGILAEHRANTFDCLYQIRDGSELSRTGPGLDLINCREIVRLHDGGIRQQSDIGKGRRFEFACPAVPAEQASNLEGTD